jgi:5-methylcytosine-specific restriction protein A
MRTLTKSAIQKAIRTFEMGERPFRFTESRSWYLVGMNGRLYPLKYIYALAVSRTPSSFNTSEPISKLKKLGFTLQQKPKDMISEFEAKVKEALKNPHERAARLAKAHRKPGQRLAQVIVFDRNPDVIAEVLSRAKGKCELCGTSAPFLRRKDRTPYLEVHHKKQLTQGGDDTVENAVATCPNCHREAHYG